MHAFDLRLLNSRIDTERFDLRSLVSLKFINADDHLIARFHRALIFVSGVLNLALYIAGFDRVQGSANRVDLIEIINCALFQLVGQLFDGIRPGQRIDRIRHA